MVKMILFGNTSEIRARAMVDTVMKSIKTGSLDMTITEYKYSIESSLKGKNNTICRAKLKYINLLIEE